MSILQDIRSEAKKGGGALSKVFWVKEGDKRRVRFLTDFEDAVKVPWVSNFQRKIGCVNPRFYGEKNPYEGDEEVKEETMYMWQVYDYDSDSVKPFLYKATQCTPVPHLAVAFETYGTICDRDYMINCSGKGKDKVMPIVGLDKSKVNPKIKKNLKLLSKKVVLDIFKKAWPIDMQGEAEDDEKDYMEMTKKELYNLCKERDLDVPSKPKEKSFYVALLEDYDALNDEEFMNEPEDDEDSWNDEDEFEQEDYEEMSPKELYVLCIKRGIKTKKKLSKSVYIDLLEDYDSDDEEDWGDEDDEDEWGDDEDEGGLPWK